LKPKIDINCDLGESYGVLKVGNDARIMPYITSANVACGFHGGDPVTMAHTIDLARKFKVAVGAHPGFPDLMGFGRREMVLAPEEAKNYMIYQISSVQGFAKAVGIELQHVKTHGALYNMAARDGELARAIVRAIRALKQDLIVFAPPKSAFAKIATKAEVRVAFEFFADRAYNKDGSLVSRTQAGSIIQEPRKVLDRTIKAVTEGSVLAINGDTFNVGEVHTVCVHGDTPAAARLAQALRKGLAKAGVQVKPVSSFI
jgi:UPF0271 protein